MYDESEIEDSLEFVKQVELYKTCRADNIFDVLGLRNTIQNGYIPPDDTGSGTERYGEDEGSAKNSVDKSFPEENAVEKSRVRWSFADLVFIVACIAISYALSYAFTHFVAHHTRVEGSSMSNTLGNGDFLIVEKVSYYMHDPGRYDIIVFPYSENVNYIKRIIGLPGEKLQIIDGRVYINDRLLEDDIYGKESIEDPGMAEEAVYLSDDEYFVMGDNRNSSIDSRSSYVGAVKQDEIEGRAVYRIWPPAGFGRIE